MSEIEATRDRLENNIRALEERLPASAAIAKRAAAVAAGGGIGGTALLLVRRRRRAKRKKAEPVQAVVQVFPEGLAEAFEGWGRAVERLATGADAQKMRRYGAAFAGVWLMIRLAELRRLRALARALASR